MKINRQWYKLKEQGAGEKRLFLTWFLYKTLGKRALYAIAFLVSAVVFFTAKERRNAGVKFFKVLQKKHPCINAFKLFVNYGKSLADKIISFSGEMKKDNFVIENVEDFKGTFFITTHVGNVEILRSLFEEDDNIKVNVFMQKNFCETFNNFLKKIEKQVNLETWAVEDIGIETSILIKEKLEKGEVVFMAGDRISAQNENACYEVDFFKQKILLPLGTLKFALLTGARIAFIVCVKEGSLYKIYVQKFIPKSDKKAEILEELKQSYTKFLEEFTLKYPNQVYNFYDVFE